MNFIEILDEYCRIMELKLSYENKKLMMILIKGILNRNPKIQSGRDFVAYCENFRDE